MHSRMTSRREHKEQLKQERLRLERAAAARSRRKRLIRSAVAGTVALAAVGAVVVAFAAGGMRAATRPAGSRAPVAFGHLHGLSSEPAPWPAEYGDLAQRLGVLGLPPVSDVVYHVHALLHVYVDGRAVTVPANLGIGPGGDAFSSLHTHDTTGVLHLEATRPFAFRLSDVFAVWGVTFGHDRLGAYRNRGAERLWVYANGRPVANPVRYVIRRHDNVVVAYGRRESFPKTPSTAPLAGL
jgi:hypothetical protein